MGVCCSVVKPNDSEKVHTDLNVHFNRKKILLEAVDRMGLKQNTMENPDAEEAEDMITSYEATSGKWVSPKSITKVLTTLLIRLNLTP
jgi:hypothetical protein